MRRNDPRLMRRAVTPVMEGRAWEAAPVKGGRADELASEDDPPDHLFCDHSEDEGCEPYPLDTMDEEPTGWVDHEEDFPPDVINGEVTDATETPDGGTTTVQAPTTKKEACSVLDWDDGCSEDDAAEVARQRANIGASTRIAFERRCQDAECLGHYTGDYSCKPGQSVSALVPHLMHGLESIGPATRHALESDPHVADSYESKKWASRGRREQHVNLETGRQALIKMETSANKSILKKLSEMTYQLMYNQECLQSHKHWTVYCGHPFSLAHKGQEIKRRMLRGEDALDPEALDAFRPYYDRGGGDGECAAPGDGQHTERASLRPMKEYEDDELAEEPDGSHVEEPCNSLPGLVLTSPLKQWHMWLLRGKRRPLSAMGLYHYCMYVYTKKDPTGTTAPDFATNLYSDLHPYSDKTIQKMRIDECYRVPKLAGCGWCPPRGKGAEQNALMKTMLFRPMCLPEDASDYGWENVSKMIGDCTDESARFKPCWDAWFKEQQRLADQFVLLRDRSRREFTLEDINIKLGPDAEMTDRQQPSAEEFMAFWTVEVCTNMDAAAEAKSRPRESNVLDPSKYAKATADEDDLVGQSERANCGTDPNALPAGGR